MTDSIKRGEIYLVNFDPSVGSEANKARPGLVVSNDINNQHSPIISIAPVTSNITRIFSFEVEVSQGVGGLHQRSKIMVNQTRAVDTMRLIKRLGVLPEELLRRVDAALKLHYGLS